MKKAIVTGANGFVGSAVCKKLTEEGVEVIALLRSEESNIEQIVNLHGIRIVYSDMSDYVRLPELVTDRDVDVIFHLAWRGSSGYTRGDYDVQLNNIRYSCNLVKSCLILDIKRFVFALSIMEYEVEKLMKQEIKPTINTTYATGKLAGNYMLRAMCENNGIDYIRTLVSNIYGSGEISTRLINTSLRKMINGEHCSFSPFNGVSLTYDEFDIDAVSTDTGFVPKVSFKEGISRTIKWMDRKYKNIGGISRTSIQNIWRASLDWRCAA